MNGIMVIAIAMFIGALMNIVIPYLLKVYKDPALEFDINYAYALVLSIIVLILGLIPAEEPATVTIQMIVAAFLTGSGLQSYLNKVVPAKVTP